MKILLDMNLSPDWREPLKAAGHETVHWSEVGSHEAPDEVLIKWCRENNHVLLTQDLDFGYLLFLAGETGPSVIQLRCGDVSPTAIASTLTEVLELESVNIGRGVLLTIYPDRHRIAVLPLRRSEATE